MSSLPTDTTTPPPTRPGEQALGCGCLLVIAIAVVMAIRRFHALTAWGGRTSQGLWGWLTGLSPLIWLGINTGIGALLLFLGLAGLLFSGFLFDSPEETSVQFARNMVGVFISVSVVTFLSLLAAWILYFVRARSIACAVSFLPLISVIVVPIWMFHNPRKSSSPDASPSSES